MCQDSLRAPCEGSPARRQPWCRPALSSGGRAHSGCAGPQGAGGRGGPSPLCSPLRAGGPAESPAHLCPRLLNSTAVSGVSGIPPDCLPPAASSSPPGAGGWGGALCPPGERVLSGTQGGTRNSGAILGGLLCHPTWRLPFWWDSGEGRGTDLGAQGSGEAPRGGRSVSEERGMDPGLCPSQTRIPHCEGGGSPHPALEPPQPRLGSQVPPRSLCLGRAARPAGEGSPPQCL